MAPRPASKMEELKQKLLMMASHAEAAVNQSVRALLRRDDELARRTREEDRLIDQLEIEIDNAVLEGLGQPPREDEQLRQLTTAMKIAHDLERVGDEATTIARRVLELSREPILPQVEAIPPMAGVAIQMLKEALDAFVERSGERARAVLPRDEEVDRQNRLMHRELMSYMAEHPQAIRRCLNLMVISKSLERIADHATNVAEMVVYLCEGRDIRHGGEATEGS